MNQDIAPAQPVPASRMPRYIVQNAKGLISRRERRHGLLRSLFIRSRNNLAAGGPVSASQRGVSGGRGSYSTKRSAKRFARRMADAA